MRWRRTQRLGEGRQLEDSFEALEDDTSSADCVCEAQKRGEGDRKRKGTNKDDLKNPFLGYKHPLNLKKYHDTRDR